MTITNNASLPKPHPVEQPCEPNPMLLDTHEGLTGGGRARTGLIWGLLFFAFEAVQGIVLPLLFKHALGAEQAAAWVTLTTSSALVGLACAAQSQAVIRKISIEQGTGLEPPGLPRNWDSLRRQLLMQQGGILAVAQLVFVVFGRGLVDSLGPHAQYPLLAYFAAQHLRLGAFANFMASNGLRQVGRDKVQLAVTSAAGLALSLLVLLGMPSVLGLGLASLLTQLGLLLASMRLIRPFPRETAAIALAGPREAGGLLLLAIAGLLNTNSDVLLGSMLMSAPAQIQYAMASRAFLVPAALVGLWVQLRFPFWSAPGMSLSVCLRDMMRLGWALGFGCACIALLYATWALLLPEAGRVVLLSSGMLAVMLANAWLASMTAGVGQVLLAKRLLGFVRPTIPLALSAPLLAYGLAHFFGAQAFVLGYFFTSLAVLLVLGLCVVAARRAAGIYLTPDD